VGKQKTSPYAVALHSSLRLSSFPAENVHTDCLAAAANLSMVWAALESNGEALLPLEVGSCGGWLVFERRQLWYQV